MSYQKQIRIRADKREEMNKETGKQGKHKEGNRGDREGERGTNDRAIKWLMRR